MTDHRSGSRQKAFLKAVVYFNRRSSSVDCLIRDLSETGARIKLPAAVTVPDVFELYIPSKDQYHPSRMRWRKEDELGLAFIADETAPVLAEGNVAGDLGHRVALLEAEVERLRRTVAKLRNDLTRLVGERDLPE